MKLRKLFRSHLPRFTLCFAGTLLLSLFANAQGAPRGFWPVADGNAAHDHWQKAEAQISTETVAKDFKFLWKLKLGHETANPSSFSEPLLVPGMITGKGFKDFLFWGDAHTLYGVDSELGALVWQKDFKIESSACGGTNLQLATEAPQVIHFGARRPAGTRPAAPPPAEEPVPAAQRRIGASAGGGYFGLKGVYVVTSDGYIHEQIMATGLDYAPPVKFFPAPAGESFGLNMNEKVVYATTGAGCKAGANTLWSIDLNSPNYKISSYKTEKMGLAGLSGPAIGPDGTAYVVTGSGKNSGPGMYADSVVALAADGLTVKDWYTPETPGKMLNAGPIVFPYKERQLVVAPGKAGSLVLLDASALGGPDHHTPLAQSEAKPRASARSEWESLATWQDRAGDTWVFASVSGPAHGNIVALKVEEKDGHMALTSTWSSVDLVSPAPPVIANGVVFALDGGNAKSHAKLYGFDAATGKQLFSSGDSVDSYSHKAGMSVGDGHVFFTTHDNTLHSFGIPLEH